MKLEIWSFSIFQDACRRQTTEVTLNAGWYNMSLWWLICMDSLTGSQILFTVNTRHRPARRSPYVKINKRMDSQISRNAPLIRHSIDGGI